MKTSVIIPAYGLCPHIDEVLAAIFNGATVPAEVVVSHSGTNNPSKTLNNKYPLVRWLHQDERLFAGAARNKGAEVAQGELLVFCDSDVVPDHSWLQVIVEAFSDSPKLLMVGAVGVLKSGGYWGMSNWICEFSEQAPWRPTGEQTGGASCNMAVFKCDFHAIGGFPEYLTPGEDTMFFALAREHGLTQLFNANMCVYHANNDGFRAFAKHQYAIGQSFAVTRQDQDLPGKIFIRNPFFTPLLWGPKILLVLSRALLAGGNGLWQGLVLSPGIVTGGLIFTFGACSKVLRRSS